MILIIISYGYKFVSFTIYEAASNNTTENSHWGI